MTAVRRRIRILIADDHTLFREGMMEILAREEDFEVVGDASSGPELLTMARSVQPDAIMVDVEMPGDGAEATLRDIRRDLPEAKIIVLTMHDDPGLVEILLTAGADAYVNKVITREALLGAVRGLMQNDGHVVISVSKRTMTRLREPPDPILSPREIEVLNAVAVGLSNAQIARRLFITEGTVKRHLTNIYGKLEVTTRMNAINKAIATGLIGPRPARHWPPD